MSLLNYININVKLYCIINVLYNNDLPRLNLEDTTISSLPRESRLVLTLYGRTQKSEDTGTDQAGEADVKYELHELGWAAIQLFDYDG